MGPPPQTSAEGPFCLWNDPGGRPRDSDSSPARSSIRAALVFEVRALSRNAALGSAGRNFTKRQAARAHRRIYPARAQVSQLPSGPPLGGAKSRALSALTPAVELRTPSAFLGRALGRSRFRRRGSRYYVLLDEIPKGCREQERDQLRPPVLQQQSLHIVRAIKSRRSVGESFPG